MSDPKSETLGALAARALAELAPVFERLAPGAEDALVEAIVKAKRIAIYGAGREGLQMDGFAMRLFHMGRDVHVVGDMTTPPLGPGDLLIISAGPGASNIGDALIDVARQAGAEIAVVTAQPKGRTAAKAGVLFHIPAQTMADDHAAECKSHLAPDPVAEQRPICPYLQGAWQPPVEHQVAERNP